MTGDISYSGAQRKKINVWYFYNAGIGSFLLGLHTVERVYFSIPASERGTCYLVTKGDVTLAKQMARMYPHVRVIRFKHTHLFGIVPILVKTFLKTNYVMFAASFGEPSLLHKSAGVLLRLARPRSSKMIGFCARTPLNKLLFTHLFVRDPERSLFEATVQSISTAIPAVYARPSLLFSFDVTKKFDESTIIFHPFPANERRALPPERNRQLIEHIRDHYPHNPLIVSGGPGNRQVYSKLVEGLEQPPPFIGDLADFRGQLQMISVCKLFIGVDTGTTHIASVLGSTVIVLGNRSNPCWLPTYHSGARILYSLEDCRCEGEKKGDCGVFIDGVKRYACLVNIKQADIHQTIAECV